MYQTAASISASCGDQADQFAVVDAHAVAGGLAPDGFDHAREGRLAVIRQVHRDLRAAFHQEASGLDEAEAAGGVPHGAGNGFGDVHVFGGEIDVEGHQRGARADDGGVSRSQPPRGP